jgi:hypothetical protein
MNFCCYDDVSRTFFIENSIKSYFTILLDFSSRIIDREKQVKMIPGVDFTL